MCRNIRRLDNFAPPASEEEIRDAALQYVRKLSGSTKPSLANRELFDRTVDSVAAATSNLLANWVTSSPPRDREVEAARAKERSRLRFGAAAT
jgi:hypothetical protein